jgi:hypothetical protein
MKPVPIELLDLVKKAAPPESEVLPLAWPYEDEDYNIAVVVSDATPYEEARQIEDRLIDAVMDYDAAHGTFTLCMVWREHEMARAGVL